jgi:CBS-domain-containing membrane protein
VRSLVEFSALYKETSQAHPPEQMNASDVMVCDVVTVGPEEAVSKAVQLLVDHDISALPGVDGERRVSSAIIRAPTRRARPMFSCTIASGS